MDSAIGTCSVAAVITTFGRIRDLGLVIRTDIFIVVSRTEDVCSIRCKSPLVYLITDIKQNNNNNTEKKDKPIVGGMVVYVGAL